MRAGMFQNIPFFVVLFCLFVTSFVSSDAANTAHLRAAFKAGTILERITALEQKEAKRQRKEQQMNTKLQIMKTKLRQMKEQREEERNERAEEETALEQKEAKRQRKEQQMNTKLQEMKTKLRQMKDEREEEKNERAEEETALRKCQSELKEMLLDLPIDPASEAKFCTLWIQPSLSEEEKKSFTVIIRDLLDLKSKRSTFFKTEQAIAKLKRTEPFLAFIPKDFPDVTIPPGEERLGDAPTCTCDHSWVMAEQLRHKYKVECDQIQEACARLEQFEKAAAKKEWKIVESPGPHRRCSKDCSTDSGKPVRVNDLGACNEKAKAKLQEEAKKSILVGSKRITEIFYSFKKDTDGADPNCCPSLLCDFTNVEDNKVWENYLYRSGGDSEGKVKLGFSCLDDEKGETYHQKQAHKERARAGWAKTETEAECRKSASHHSSKFYSFRPWRSFNLHITKKKVVHPQFNCMRSDICENKQQGDENWIRHKSAVAKIADALKKTAWVEVEPRGFQCEHSKATNENTEETCRQSADSNGMEYYSFVPREPGDNDDNCFISNTCDTPKEVDQCKSGHKVGFLMGILEAIDTEFAFWEHMFVVGRDANRKELADRCEECRDKPHHGFPFQHHFDNRPKIIKDFPRACTMFAKQETEVARWEPSCINDWKESGTKIQDANKNDKSKEIEKEFYEAKKALNAMTKHKYYEPEMWKTPKAERQMSEAVEYLAVFEGDENLPLIREIQTLSDMAYNKLAHSCSDVTQRFKHVSGIEPIAYLIVQAVYDTLQTMSTDVEFKKQIHEARDWSLREELWCFKHNKWGHFSEANTCGYKLSQDYDGQVVEEDVTDYQSKNQKKNYDTKLQKFTLTSTWLQKKFKEKSGPWFKALHTEHLSCRSTFVTELESRLDSLVMMLDIKAGTKSNKNAGKMLGALSKATNIGGAVGAAFGGPTNIGASVLNAGLGRLRKKIEEHNKWMAIYRPRFIESIKALLNVASPMPVNAELGTPPDPRREIKVQCLALKQRVESILIALDAIRRCGDFKKNFDEENTSDSNKRTRHQSMRQKLVHKLMQAANPFVEHFQTLRFQSYKSKIHQLFKPETPSALEITQIVRIHDSISDLAANDPDAGGWGGAASAVADLVSEVAGDKQVEKWMEKQKQGAAVGVGAGVGLALGILQEALGGAA